MAEWNLSVRLTGQGSGLARTLREVSSDARAASRDVNALRRDLTLLRDEARNNIRVRLDLDADHLRADVRAALTAADTGDGLSVSLHLANADELRRDVQNAVRWAAQGHRIEIPLVLADSMQLRRDVSAAVRWASMNQTITVRVNPDTSALNGLNNTINNHGGGGGDAGGLGLNGLLTLAPAAIPLAAGLAAQLAPLAAEFTAAGIAGGAFGIALAGQIGPLSDLADAQDKVEKATVQYGATSQQAVEAQQQWRQMLETMPQDTQRAAIALSTLKSDFQDWSDSLAGFTMTPVTKGISILDDIIPKLTPEVQSASKQLDRLVTTIGGTVASPGFDAFSDKVAKFTDGRLDQLTDQAIHLMRVLMQGGGSVSGPLAQFIEYARQNGPAAKEALTAIAQAAAVVAQAAAQAGPGMLTLVTAAARLVAALPPELVTVILQVAAALKLMSLAGAAAAAVGGRLTRVSAQITAMRAASLAAGGGITGLTTALSGLSTKAKAGLAAGAIGGLVLLMHELSDHKATVEVDALSTSLNTLVSTGKLTGTLKTNLKDVSESIAMVSKGASDNKFAQLTSDFGTFVGISTGPSISDARKNVDAWDKSMANLVRSGNPQQAAAQYQLLKKAWVAGGGDLKRLKKFTNDYDNALADAKFEQQTAAQSMGLFGKAAQDTQAKLDAQKKSADGLRQSIQALNDINRQGLGGMIGFEAAIDAASSGAKKYAGVLSMNNGQLSLSTQKQRDAAQVLSDLAAKTDEAAAANRQSTGSWEGALQIYSRGRAELVKSAQAMGLTRDQASALADQILKIPDKKTRVQMDTEDATRDLNSFNAAVKKSPGSKSVTLKTLSASAEKILEDFGFKVRRLPNGKVTVTAKTGSALHAIGSVKAAVDSLHNKTIGIGIYKTTYLNTVHTGTAADGKKYPGVTPNARGSVTDFYADGGMRRESHVAQIAPAGSWRVWAEPETGGEAYIPLAAGKRSRSRKIAEEAIRRLGGDPTMIQWNVDGSVTDWRYDPQTGSLYSPSDAGQAGHKTKKVKGKSVDYFDLGAVESKIKSTAKATLAWDKDLEKVADRVGGDVAEALASMGADGQKLAHKMATGSTKYINDMAAALRNLQTVAKASLTDYTRQLTKANSVNATFANNLAKLAGQGYGDLAAQLAAQNDVAAQQLAASAVKDKGKASAANAQAKKANDSLTSSEVAELVQIIAAIKTKDTGIHAVAAATSIGEDEIITVGNKAKSQISSSLGSRATKFLADLSRASKHLSYADGGLRAGLYATRGGIVRFAEPETHGEAYLPLSPTKRRTALPVLADVANRFGLRVVDAQATRPVVVVREGGDTHVQVTAVRTGASASDIGAQVGRSVRRASRGGVAARAA